MSENKRSLNKNLFYKYAADCLGNEYNLEMKSNSLADLYQLAGLKLKDEDI